MFGGPGGGGGGYFGLSRPSYPRGPKTGPRGPKRVFCKNVHFEGGGRGVLKYRGFSPRFAQLSPVAAVFCENLANFVPAHICHVIFLVFRWQIDRFGRADFIYELNNINKITTSLVLSRQVK